MKIQRNWREFECVYKNKKSSSRFATPTRLLGYLERFKGHMCLVYSVVLLTDCIRPLTVERIRYFGEFWGFL